MLALLVCACLCIVSPAAAVLVEQGYFSGADLVPLLGAKTSVLGIEPACVLVISTTAPSLEASDKFELWAHSTHNYKYVIYGVVVVPPDQLPEVTEEVIRQRGFSFPMFQTHRDFLVGASYRALVVDRGTVQQIPSLDTAAMERVMGAVAARAGLIPTNPNAAPGDTSNTTEPVTSSGSSGTYVNHRYNFAVDFPRGWKAREAQNQDGAVAKGPPDSKLDVRVWAVQNNEDASGNAGRLSLTDYMKKHIKYISEDAGAEVNLERRFVVHDDDVEGRDYIYSYRKGGADGEGALMRGRVQVFESSGQFKAASAEGPAAEYDKNKEMIEQFIVSFRPRAE